jgi:hypothetical protein
MAQPPPHREGNQDMPTGLETKKVIVGRAEAGVGDTVADPTGRRGHARRAVAELKDVAITGVHPSTQSPAKPGGGF